METILQPEPLWSLMLPAIINLPKWVEMLIHLDTSQNLT